MASMVEGIWNQASRTNPVSARPMDTGNTTGSEANSNSASISANDFLTLLVTEMKNQDPTANTDPNEYINQLVQVNSLEQLISINETLTADSAAPSSSTTPSPDLAGPPRKLSIANPTMVQGDRPNHLQRGVTADGASGNLTIPVSNPAATRVAQSLGKH